VYPVKQPQQLSQLDDGTVKTVTRTTQDKKVTYTVSTVVVHNNKMFTIETFTATTNDLAKRIRTYCAGRCYFITESYKFNIYDMNSSRLYQLEKFNTTVFIRGDYYLSTYMTTPKRIPDSNNEVRTYQRSIFLGDEHYGRTESHIRYLDVYNKQNKKLYDVQCDSYVVSNSDFLIVCTNHATGGFADIWNIRTGTIVKEHAVDTVTKHLHGKFASFKRSEALFKELLYGMISRQSGDVVIL
jgi:hypothetical protein